MDEVRGKAAVNINQAFQVYSMAIIAILLAPMLFSTVYMVYGYVNNTIIDLSDHSIRLVFVLFSILGFGFYFLIIEIYLIYSFAISINKLTKINILKGAISLIISFLIFSGIEILIFLCTITENWLLLLLITLVLIMPYFYIIYLKIKYRNKRSI